MPDPYQARVEEVIMKGFTHAGAGHIIKLTGWWPFLASEAAGWVTGQVIRARGSS